MDSGTLFESASLTKTLFGTLVLRLAQEGRLDIDRPIMDTLQDTPWSDDPRFVRITPRQCLCHACGLPNWEAKPMHMLFDPGQQYSYSGEGYFLTQRLVEQITEKDLNDVLEVRLGLEELAVKLACQRITESELQKLYQASRSFEQMLETTETDDLQKLAQADVVFHDVIYQATNNERLIQLLNNLREQMYRYRIEYLKDVKSRRSLVEEHDALYERMKNRDLAGAQKMIREHIERQQESIMQTVHHQSMTGVEEK